MVDACAPPFSNDGTVRRDTKDTQAMLALLAVLCTHTVCVCVLGLSQVLKVPPVNSQFFSVRCATRGIWLGWNSAVAITFYKIKSFHCFFFVFFIFL